MNLMIPLAMAAMALGAAEPAQWPVQRETHVYARPGGHALKLTLRQPKAAPGVRPGVVLVHGGGWTFGNRLLKAWYGRELARRGYVTVAVEYRKIPRWTIVDCIHDVKAAVRWLRAHAEDYALDPGRIAVLGDSAGGHLALMMAATRPDDGFEHGDPEISSLVQAAVSLYPVTELRSLDSSETSDALRHGHFLSFIGETPPQQPDPLDAISPLAYVHPGMAPVLLIHGSADPLVPFAQSVSFYERLRAEGVPVRLVAFPRWGHGFDYLRPFNQRKVLALTLDFLSKHMPAAQGPDEPAS